MSEKIIYEPHPVSPERVEELRAQGFTIIDAIYDPNRWAKNPAPAADEYRQIAASLSPEPFAREPAPIKRGPGRPRKEPVTDGA